MNPGDLALVNFPFSASERQPYKRRPVLVLGVHGSVPDRAIFVAMVTSNARRVARPGPGDLVVPNWQQTGLLMPSVIRTRRIWTAEDRDVVNRLGSLDAQTLEQARTAVRALLT